MFVPPNAVYGPLTFRLKLISSQIGVAMIQLYGLSAFREGNVIDLGFTQLQVVDACSGLRFVIPLFLMGLLLAYYYRAPFWKKFVLVLSTIPISIFTNSLRIASVGILFQFWGPKVAEGFFHDFSGWFIFVVSLGFLLFEMWVLNKCSRSKGEGLQEVHGVEVQESRVRRVAGTRKSRVPGPRSPVPGFQSPVDCGGGAAGGDAGAGPGGGVPRKDAAAEVLCRFPAPGGRVERHPDRDGAAVPRHPATDRLRPHRLPERGEERGQPLRGLQRQPEQGKGDPFPGHLPPRQRLGIQGVGRGRLCRHGSAGMRVNRAFMEKSGARNLVYYWFPQRGRILTNLYQVKLYNFWDAITRHRTDGALVRLITPVYQGEAPAEAEARLQGFTRQIMPVLETYLPK